MFRILLALALSATVSVSLAQGALSSVYPVKHLKGVGTYTLADGTVAEDKLSFSTRNHSLLLVGSNLVPTRYKANEVRSFTIDGHTLVPAGTFDFDFGVHQYQAQNAFIELVDTTGFLQLAQFHTAEPVGPGAVVSFTCYLLRRRGDREFVQGPDNYNKWNKGYRLELAEELGRWPELQQAVRSGAATFETLPAYIRRANQQTR